MEQASVVELLRYIVEQLAENDFDVAESGSVVTVTLAKSDMGKVIGRQGKIIKAIRTIIKANVPKERQVTVEVVEKPE